MKHAACRYHTLSPPSPFLSFNDRASTHLLSPSSWCPRRTTGTSLLPPPFLPLLGELTSLATIVLFIYLLSPLRGPLKLHEPFTAAADHQSVVTAVER
jgi:hypothetical protein